MDTTPMTDEEKQASSELFCKYNKAVNMEGFKNRPKQSFFVRLFEGLPYKIKEWNEDHNPFSEYKIVGSAEEYKNLPRYERIVAGFWYKDPLICGSNILLGSKKDREEVKQFLKDTYPIQYFVREHGFTLKVKLSRAYDFVKETINPRQKWLYKVIPKSWSDKTYLIPEINFAMVLHFVEGESAFDVTDWEASSDPADTFSKQLKECYNYIKVLRPALQKRFENSYPDEETKTGDYYVDYAEHNRIELELNKKDTEYLVWIVTNRDFFWT